MDVPRIARAPDRQHHHHVNGTSPPHYYMINDEIIVSVFLLSVDNLCCLSFILPQIQLQLATIVRLQELATRIYYAGPSHSHCADFRVRIWISRHVFRHTVHQTDIVSSSLLLNINGKGTRRLLLPIAEKLIECCPQMIRSLEVNDSFCGPTPPRRISTFS